MSPSSVTPRSPHHQEDVIERVRARARAANLRVARVSAARLARERQLASRLARRLATADANRDALMRRRVDTAARRTRESRVASPIHGDARGITSGWVQRAWRRFASGSQSFASGSQSFASGSQSFASGSRSLARTPPGAASPSTTFALARRFASARVTLDANRRDFRRVRRDFAASGDASRDARVTRANARETRRGRRKSRRGPRVRRAPSVPRAAERTGETNRAFEKANRRTAEPPNGDVAFPPRVVLCAYMIDAHPDVVLGAADDESNQDEDEDEATATATANATARRPRFAHEIDLRRSAAALVTALNEVVASAARLTSDDSSKAPVPVAVAASDFGTAWRRYLSDFARWKIADASALELELTRAAAALEASALRVCAGRTRRWRTRPSRTRRRRARRAPRIHERFARKWRASPETREWRGSTPPSRRRASPSRRKKKRRRERRRTRRTRKTNRRRDEPTPPRVRRFARVAARRRATRFARLARRRRRRDTIGETTASSPSRPSSDSATRASSFAEEANEAIMHELLVDPEWRLPEWRDAARDANDSSLGARVRETMERAFWDRVRDAVAAGVLADPKGSSDADVSRDVTATSRATSPATSPLADALSLVAELREALEALIPAPRQTPAESTLVASLSRDDVASVLSIAAREPTRAGATLGALVDGAAAMLRRAGSPAREADASRRAASLSSTLRASFASAASAAASNAFPVAADAVARAVVDALRFLHGELKTLKRDAGNAALSSMAPLARGEGGVEWARRRFAARRCASAENPVEAIDALPRLLAWFAREVDVAHALDADRSLGSLGSLGTSFRVLPRPSDVRDGDGVSAAPTSIRAGRGLADDGTVANARTATSTNAWRRAVVCAPEGLFRCALASLAAGRRRRTARRSRRRSSLTSRASTERAPSFGKSDSPPRGSSRARNSHARRARPRTGLRVRKRWPTLGVDSTRSSRTPSSDMSDLALELASSAASSETSSDTSSVARIDAATVAAAETRLRRRAVRIPPRGRELHAAILDALRARLLVGPTRSDDSTRAHETQKERGVRVESSSEAASVRSAAAAATTRSLAAVGFVEEEAAVVADDVARARPTKSSRGVGRVTWAVHGPYYHAAGTRLLEETDEL